MTRSSTLGCSYWTDRWRMSTSKRLCNLVLRATLRLFLVKARYRSLHNCAHRTKNSSRTRCQHCHTMHLGTYQLTRTRYINEVNHSWHLTWHRKNKNQLQLLNNCNLAQSVQHRQPQTWITLTTLTIKQFKIVVQSNLNMSPKFTLHPCCHPAISLAEPIQQRICNFFSIRADSGTACQSRFKP